MNDDLMTRLASGIRIATVLAASLGLLVAPAGAADPAEKVVEALNERPSVVGTEPSKSYPILFAAYLELGEPPMPVTEAFNNTTIHPGMSQWSAVSGWAESNPGMARALLECEGKTLFGLPYGRMGVDGRFRDRDLVADVGVDGSLRNNQFPYLDAIETIAAFATAESYRLMEAGRTKDGLDLALANVFMLRQCCDREFIDEVLYAVALMIECLENLRDQLYLYLDGTDASTFARIAIEKLPFLRPDHQRLLMPEGDKIVSQALIRDVFDDRGQADREKFADTFAGIQSRDLPLTRFGAARRWRMIADVHDSQAASLERLGLVYDDWWRRWRVEEYDPILDIESQFERTNPVRFAAVIYSMRDIEKLFHVRKELIAAVNGTSMAAGLCGYKRQYGTYPSDSDKMYAQFVRKRSDKDPFDIQFQPFKYRVLDARFSIDATGHPLLYVEPGECILYSKGSDHVDDRGAHHSADGSAGDLVLWPPVKALLRREGYLE